MGEIQKFLTKYWDVWVLLICCSIYAGLFSSLAILRHNAFASSFDLANMGQTVWSTFAGKPFTLSGAETTISRFAIHGDIILALLAPFYWIWPRVAMLLVIQSVALGFGAVPVFFLAKKVLSQISVLQKIDIKIISLVIVLVYLLNPGMQWTNIYDFHGVSLAIPFLLAAFYFAYSRRWVGYVCFVLLALLTKEQISLFITVLGFIVAFIFREHRIGFATALLGIFWFGLMFFVVIPGYSEGGKHWALDWLAVRNTTSGEIVLPSAEVLLRQYTLSPDALNYYQLLLRPFALLPLLGLPWLVLSLPELMINLLSSQAQMRGIFFHYESGITPALVIATIFAYRYIYLFLHFISKKFHRLTSLMIRYLLLCIAVLSLVVAVRTNYHYSPLPTTPSCWCLMYRVTEEDRQFAKVLQDIPQGATVTSSSEVRAHLTRRENSFNLPNATESAQYIAILNQNRIVGDYEPKEFETKLIEVLRRSTAHEIIHASEHFYLFKRIEYR